MVNIQCIGITELKCGKHTMYRYYGIKNLANIQCIGILRLI